ncbi:glycosyltransferase [Niallia circulans]|uniref:glycosyltransferase n=1 Tax=Niallia circulans TaxID=1397 RepID=UPI002E1AEBD6|nr:glycosyltransferase [Niallia circulans]MED5098988.1 glycosyltransferase [Niallia circulans]
MITIAAADNKYVKHLGVMIQSLVTNNSNSNKLKIIIIDGGISIENKKKLELLVSQNLNVKLVIIDPDSSDIKNLRTDKHITEAAYLRLLIPKIVNEKKVEKIIYLDSDIIVNKDIKKLWDVDISNHSIAAVETLNFNRHNDLNMIKGAKYFNSGVLCINLIKWRKENLTDRIIKFINENSTKVIYHDQDGMNAILYNDWIELDSSWNLTSQLLYLGKYSKAELPHIIHYTEASKPWHLLNNHPFKKEYEKYLAMTPWKDDIPPENAIIHKLLLDKRIVIFGSGGSGRRLLERVMELNGNVSYFLDNNIELSGKRLNGKKIYSPNMLADENIDEIFIIIASMYYVDIEKQLTELGLKRLKHFVSLGYENELLKEW